MSAKRPKFLGEAAALLFPIFWPEPFGIVMIEAMACGTPVIAFPAGSAPEVIEDGVSGWLVNDVDEAVGAVKRAETFDRAKARACFERDFTIDRVARDYLNIYRNLSGSAPRKPARSPPGDRLGSAGRSDGERLGRGLAPAAALRARLGQATGRPAAAAKD